MGLAPVLAGQDFTAAEVNQLPVVVSPLALGSVANSAAETIIGTYTVPAGTITAAQQGLAFKGFVTVAEAGGPTCRLRIRLNGGAGTVLYDTGAITMGNTAALCTLDGEMFFTAVGAGGTVTFLCAGYNTLASSGTAAPVVAVSNGNPWNTGAAVTLVVTAQFGTASASNTAATVAGNMYQL